MEFEPVKCNFCGEDKPKKLVTCKIEKQDADLPIGKMTIVKCTNCGLIFVNPRPKYSPEEFELLYSEEYFNASYMKFYMEKEAEQSNEPFSFRLDWIENFKKTGKILDIGCASGGFLLEAKDRGWDTYGVEVSKAVADLAKEKHGLKVINARLNEADFDNDFFDVVMAGDILEHVENPKSFLLEISRITKKGGLLYLAVPDFDGFWYKFALLVSRFNQRNYFVLPHHIYFFNKDSVSGYLKETNFKLVDYKKTESNISTKGFTGKIMWFIFFISRLINRPDRIIFIAIKQ